MLVQETAWLHWDCTGSWILVRQYIVSTVLYSILITIVLTVGYKQYCFLASPPPPPQNSQVTVSSIVFLILN